MAHELAHVIQRHTLQSVLFQEALKDSGRPFDRAVLTHVTRLHEIEADRESIVMAFLAGYHPRGGIEIMEARGQIDEIPAGLDHPTFDERVHYLEEYWSNDVKYAFVSFKMGVAALGKGDWLAATSPDKAVSHYKQALKHFRRFRNTLRPTKAVLNNMGVVQAKIGIYVMGRASSPLHRWQSPFSIEKQSALRYVAVAPAGSITRGATSRAKRREAPTVPRELKQAMRLFRDALKRDAGYQRARANLAAAYLAAGQLDKAARTLAKARAHRLVGERLALLRGVLHAERKRYREAEAEFKVAQNFKPISNQATYNLARTYQLWGQTAKARAEYQRYLKYVPRGAWAAAARKALKEL
ncbi:MAG: tetratricopeptide repeat protein, partial [Myxococcota bacterium]